MLRSRNDCLFLSVLPSFQCPSYPLHITANLSHIPAKECDNRQNFLADILFFTQRRLWKH